MRGVGEGSDNWAACQQVKWRDQVHALGIRQGVLSDSLNQFVATPIGQEARYVVFHEQRPSDLVWAHGQVRRRMRLLTTLPSTGLVASRGAQGRDFAENMRLTYILVFDWTLVRGNANGRRR